MKNFLIMVLCLSLTGCASSTSQIVKPYTEPQYGMTKMQMLDLLGKPDSIEIYKKSDLSRVEYYIYIRQYEPTLEKVPVCLINNKVAGWGKSYYEDHVSPDDIRIK
jgi:hypothetical protein